MRELGEQLINALALGSVYALIALGYTMVYGIVKLINFAHGDILMIGAYASYFVIGAMGVTPISMILAFLISMAVCSILGVIIEKICYKPLRNSPKIVVLITAIGVSILLENGARVLPFIGPNYRQYLTFENVSIPIFNSGLNISLAQLIQIGVSLILMCLLFYIVNMTKVGKAMRAASYDKDAALLMGINVDRIISFTFALGAALGAAAGVLFASAYPQIDPYMGIMPGLKAFVAAVLGGIGSIPGALLGGYLMGTAETLTIAYVSSKLANAVVFGLLIVILIVKPAGILGKNTREKV